MEYSYQQVFPFSSKSKKIRSPIQFAYQGIDLQMTSSVVILKENLTLVDILWATSWYSGGRSFHVWCELWINDAFNVSLLNDVTIKLDSEKDNMVW